MLDIQQAVNDSMNKLIESETIQQIINSQIQKTIEEAVSQSLRSYSDFGKGLSAKIAEAVNGVEYDLPLYNKYIAEVIQDQFSHLINQNGAEILSRLVQEKIKPPTKFAKFSDIISDLEDLVRQHCEESGEGEYSLKVQVEEGAYRYEVKIDDPDNAIEGQLRIVFYNFDHEEGDLWHIGYIHGDTYRQPVTGKSINFAGDCLLGVRDDLYQYYLQQTRFERDVEFDDINICLY